MGSGELMQNANNTQYGRRHVVAGSGALCLSLYDKANATDRIKGRLMSEFDDEFMATEATREAESRKHGYEPGVIPGYVPGMTGTIDGSLLPKFTKYGPFARGVDSSELYEKRKAYLEKKKSEKMSQALHEKGKLELLDMNGDKAQALPLDCFPKELQAEGDQVLFAWNTYADNGPIVNRIFKECHDRVQPDSNQFVPVKVFHEDGTEFTEEEGAPFYYFNITTFIDVINTSLGGLKLVMGSGKPEDNPQEPLAVASMGSDKLAVDRDAIRGLAAWTDYRMPNRTFFSSSFLAELAKERCEGFEVSKNWHEL